MDTYPTVPEVVLIHGVKYKGNYASMVTGKGGIKTELVKL